MDIALRSSTSQLLKDAICCIGNILALIAREDGKRMPVNHLDSMGFGIIIFISSSRNLDSHETRRHEGESSGIPISRRFTRALPKKYHTALQWPVTLLGPRGVTSSETHIYLRETK